MVWLAVMAALILTAAALTVAAVAVTFREWDDLDPYWDDDDV